MVGMDVNLIDDNEIDEGLKSFYENFGFERKEDGTYEGDLSKTAEIVDADGMSLVDLLM